MTTTTSVGIAANDTAASGYPPATDPHLGSVRHAGDLRHPVPARLRAGPQLRQPYQHAGARACCLHVGHGGLRHVVLPASGEFDMSVGLVVACSGVACAVGINATESIPRHSGRSLGGLGWPHQRHRRGQIQDQRPHHHPCHHADGARGGLHHLPTARRGHRGGGASSSLATCPARHPDAHLADGGLFRVVRSAAQQDHLRAQYPGHGGNEEAAASGRGQRGAPRSSSSP